ncbi:MAG: hypothetical protein ACI8QZ_003381 [Chlamydiales bacterium]|jgi:hypothetical protein
MANREMELGKGDGPDHDAGASASRSYGILFAVAVFSSAFLIFFVQPMVGKHILPWFGGSPGVWTLCLAFYQASLFAGYAYAHALVRMRPGVQLVVHASVFGLAVLVLPVLPEAVWKPALGQDPSGQILSMLAANVALPFMLLAATGPLLQAWYTRVFTGRSPYRLYAISNTGSLLALISFPVLVEPNLPLSSASSLWTASFMVCGALVIVCGACAARAGAFAAPATSAEPQADPSGSAGGNSPLLWLGLAASAVVLLMGVTNELCLDVASVPFLWVLPLAVYLLTFILCFASERFYQRGVMRVSFAIACAALLVLGQRQGGSGGVGALDVGLRVQIGLYTLLLFTGCMLAHGELYRARPAPRLLTRFYLWVSGGGALGGLAVGVGAPHFFDGYRELPLGVLLCVFCLGAAHWRGSAAPRSHMLAWASAGVAVLVAAGAWYMSAEGDDGLLRPQERNFFGVLRVKDLDRGDPSLHRYVLQSGRIDHGLQLVDPARRRRPTSYYGESSGIGLMLAGRPDGRQSRLGLIGLGVGTLATYGRAGDSFRYYEIDPDVARIARDDGDFTFLEDSAADVEIVLGDARLSLESERERGADTPFDILVVDAFSSDSIPVHLLTREAFSLYKERLAPGGVLAVHVSNRHLRLSPLVYAVGRSAGLRAVRIQNSPGPQGLSLVAIWILLAENPGTMERLVRRVTEQREMLGISESETRFGHPPRDALEAAPVWTDDYSDLLSVLRVQSTSQ